MKKLGNKIMVFLGDEEAQYIKRNEERTGATASATVRGIIRKHIKDERKRQKLSDKEKTADV